MIIFTIRLKNQNTKTADKGSSCGVDPTGLAPASPSGNNGMLLYAPQARVHGNSIKQKKPFYKDSFYATRILPVVLRASVVVPQLYQTIYHCQ